MADLTVAAVPFYFGSMGAEYVALKKRAETVGPTSADYVRNDTLGNLAMGVGSLLVPLVSHQVITKVAPGKGKYGKALLGTVAASAVVTTIADAVVRKLDTADLTDENPNRASNQTRKIRRLAKKVAAIGGVTTIASGALASGTFIASRATAVNFWRNGGKDRDLGNGPLAWAIAIFGWDFIYYWNHRSWHEVRAMWASHVVHHSSERYNLSTALRQPVSDILGASIPYGLISKVGVNPHLVAQARGINLIYQFWIHTDVIRTLGPFEKVLNTASHHRVHHGSNRKYLDRNHGSILIIWDKMFGTFQAEEEQVVYGLTKNINSDNPIDIASSEYKEIVRDIANSDNWTDRLSFVLRGPGWAYDRHAQGALPNAAPPKTRLVNT